MLYFSLFYFVFLYSFFIFKEFLFFNEEVLIAACMIIVFFFLVKSLRKMVNFIFFFKAETIYFSFLNLILLNIKLIDKMLNLVKLERLRFDSLLSLQLYTSFNTFSTELLATSKLLNLLFMKNFIYALVSNIYTLQFFATSSNFLTSIAVNAAKGLTTELAYLKTQVFIFYLLKIKLLKNF